MIHTFLLLGSNEGNRERWIQKGCDLLEQKCGTLVRTSSYYQTKAWGLEEQPDFINQVIALKTTLTAQELLAAIGAIEQECGRQRILKWGQRTLDIDILFYGSEIIHTQTLIIPHPYIAQRRFTLVPLCEIAPTFVHPVLHKSITTLLKECSDPLATVKIDR
jgi:2-amino-4-hydroxy-6-hydroxymethyldihydropteridine diphosphokinase